jgi:hypothetical protein
VNELEDLQERLRRALDHNTVLEETNRSLKRTCFHYRLICGAVIGIELAALVYLHAMHAAILHAIADFSNNASVSERVSFVATVAAMAPVLYFELDWAWQQYKGGSSGMLRRIAEIYKVFRRERQ